MSIEIVQQLQMAFVSQHSERGYEMVKLLLCKQPEDGMYFACTGIGDIEWIIQNGRRLKFTELGFHFDPDLIPNPRYFIEAPSPL